MSESGGRHMAVWTIILTSAALFIVTLDNLVVSTLSLIHISEPTRPY